MTSPLDSLYPGDHVALLIFNVLIQITAVILLTMFIARRCVRRAAAARHATWLSCLAFVAVCPLITSAASRAGLSIVSLPLAPKTTVTTGAEVPAAPSPVSAPAVATVNPAEPQPAVSGRQPSNATLTPKRLIHSTAQPSGPAEVTRPMVTMAVSIALAIWATGSLLFAIRLLHGGLCLRKLGRTTTPLDESELADVLARVRRSLGVRNLPPILLSEQITTPVVAALSRPAILLPALLPESITRDSLHDVLVHESAHIIRCDHWVGVLQRLVETVYWFHPLVRHMNRQLACCREEVCDNYVLSSVEPTDYADTLLGLTVRFQSRVGALSSIGMFGLHWRLEDRVRGLLDERRDKSVRLRNRSRLAVLVSACVVFAGAAMLQIDTAAGEKEEGGRANDGLVEHVGGGEVEASRASAAEVVRAKDAKSAELKQANESGVNVSAFGKVVDAKGSPVASAAVYLRESASLRTGASLYDRSPRDVLASMKTDAEGTFRFEKVTSPPIRDGLEAPWDVIVVAEGYGMAWRHLKKAEDKTPVNLTLRTAATLTGRLVDKDGQPIAGAEVGVGEFAGLGSRVRDSSGLQDRIGIWRSQLAMIVQTDVDGRFSIAGLPPETRVRLIGKHDRYARTLFYAATTDTPQPDLEDVSYLGGERRETAHKVHTGDFTVSLEPGYQIRGRVIFADTKQPCPEAKVSLFWESRAHYATADAEGRFAFRGLSLSPSQWYVSASTSKKGDHLGRRIHVRLREGQPPDTDVNIELPRGELVAGSVVGEGGEPIPGARVYFRDELPKDAPDRAVATAQATDGDGAFRIVVPPGKGRLIISGPVDDYDLPAQRYGQEPDPRFVRSIEVKRGKPVRDVRFTVGRGLVINGRVADPQGKPVAGAKIKTVETNFRDGRFRKATTNTDADGKFTLSGFPPPDAVAVEIRHPQRRLFGKASVEADEQAGAARVANVDVKLQRTATVKGRVSVDGRPVAGVRVNLRQHRTYEGKRYGIGVDYAETDDSGRFSFDLAPPGEGFYVSHYSEELTQMNSRSFGLQPEQVHELPTVELRRKGMSVAGIVVDPDGNPVEGVTVSVSERAGRSIAGAFTRQPTGKDGRFVIRGVPNVPLNIMAYIDPPDDAPDRRIRFPARVDAEPGETDVRIILDAKLVRGVR